MEKMHVSCGALAYTYDDQGRLGIILGREKGNWLPFKGCIKEGETDIQTASRELYEETCGLVYIDAKKIKLSHIFETKRKEYRIALVYMPYGKIEEFRLLRHVEDRHEYLEKDTLQFFLFDDNILSSEIHNITKASIQYYWNTLSHLKHCKRELTGRKHAVSHQYACEHCTPQYIDKSIKIMKTITDANAMNEGNSCASNGGNNEATKLHDNVASNNEPHRIKLSKVRKSSFLKRPRYYGLTSARSNDKHRDLRRTWRKEITST